MTRTIALGIALLSVLGSASAGVAQNPAPQPGPAPLHGDAEMAALFAADQEARADAARIDWTKVRADDAERRRRTQALIDAGRLKTGEDFYAAAFVLQHGDVPDDYLKAHALAMVAVARGMPQATWIAAATLDRYLQRIGQRQIYGTQFVRPGTMFTQEPYDRTLLPDAVREASGVPPLAAQEAQRAEWDRKMPLPPTSKRP